jgi:hypothetical protein
LKPPLERSQASIATVAAYGFVALPAMFSAFW